MTHLPVELTPVPRPACSATADIGKTNRCQRTELLHERSALHRHERVPSCYPRLVVERSFGKANILFSHLYRSSSVLERYKTNSRAWVLMLFTPYLAAHFDGKKLVSTGADSLSSSCQNR